MTGSVVPPGPTLRNEEGLGDQDPEVVQDFRGVDQFQMAGGRPVTQHLGPWEEEEGHGASFPLLWERDSRFERACASQGPTGTWEVQVL